MANLIYTKVLHTCTYMKNIVVSASERKIIIVLHHQIVNVTCSKWAAGGHVTELVLCKQSPPS